jgi:hypothetical protein
MHLAAILVGTIALVEDGGGPLESETFGTYAVPPSLHDR